MHQTGPTFWLKFTEHSQKHLNRLRETEIFCRDKCPQQKEVYPLHQEADAGFQGHRQPRQLTGQLTKEEQEKGFPHPPGKQRWPKAAWLYRGARPGLITNIPGAQHTTWPKGRRVGGRPTVVIVWRTLGPPGQMVA